MNGKQEGYGAFDALVDTYDGYTFWFEQGYSATFRFWLATEVGENEHPYRYELVLHDPNNERILGYDNAHPVNWKTGMFKHRSEFPDHFHRTKSDKGVPYEFVSISRVLEDFFCRSERSLKVLNISPTVTKVTKTPENNFQRGKK